MDSIYGLKIVVSEYARSRRWVYPRERFWTYEPSKETEKWCRFFGFGHEVEEPAAIQVGRDTLLIHPIVYEQLKKEFRKDFNSTITAVV